MKEKELIDLAKEVSQKAYAPYSHFKVGAALLTKSGKVFTGCNVENASYGLTICAERNAVFKAISEGEKEFEKIVIYNDSDRLFSPCGACRQVLAEFSPNLEIIINSNNKIIRSNIEELLPLSFEL